MREFRDPATIGIFKAIGAVVSVVSGVKSLFTKAPRAQVQQVKPAADESAAEDAAKAEAERKQVVEEKARQGRRKTLVVPPTEGILSSELPSQRRTLLGGTA